MNVCFTGVGSIAIRHMKNLRSIYGDDINITALRSGMGRELFEDENALIDTVIHDHDEMATEYDAIFITNPTAMHYDTLTKVFDRSDAFFVEKPVFLTGNEDISAFDEKAGSIYVACPLRYSPVIGYLKENIDTSSVLSVRCICSSYLPDWRPGTDYRKTYSASRALGGGVAIDLIHEWDYLTYLFGFPEKVRCFTGKKSDLEIDSDDIAVYIAEYPEYMLELHLDYFGRKPARTIDIFTKDDVIVCDLYANSVVSAKDGKLLEAGGERDDYQKKELERFVDIAAGRAENGNDLFHACRVLRLTRGEL